jgi:non-lysosomal glucosylceramidase
MFKDQVFTQEQLYSMMPQKWYPAEASEVGFLLGGIGTGNITMNSRGELTDWEIFNRPGKGDRMHYSFFSIWAKPEGEKSVAKVLESKLTPPYTQTHGYHSGAAAGLPRLDHSRLKGEYPFVQLEFEDEQLPVQVSLEAFTPFIPLNADDSGIPGAIFRYKAVNTSDAAVDVTIAASIPNLAGFEGYDVFENMKFAETPVNEYREENGMKGVFFHSPGLHAQHLRKGSLALMTEADNVTGKATWLTGGWWDGIQDFWDDFSADGKLEKESVSQATMSEFGPQFKLRVGSLGICHRLKPGEEGVFEFVLTWHFPNRVKSWDEDSTSYDSHPQDKGNIEHNYYSTQFSDAWDTGTYLLGEKSRLEQDTREFHRALFTSTLPDYVLDALSSNITVLRSPTCFRIQDGTFLGFEGSHDHHGSCEGTCTHVWNYAQTLAYLFPELEQTAREVEFNLETDEDGKMAFRTWQIFGKEKFNMLPATDGQLGTIIRLYREWKISGNCDFLRRVWVKASKALDFAFDYWDTDGDFVLDSRQHNTYDIEFYGLSSLTNSMFFAALKAGAEMALYLGDLEHAEKYQEAFEIGSKKMDEQLWNGEYYVQQIEDVDQHRYQYGNGCLSDQLFGQLLAHVAGIGYIFPEEHVKKAVQSIYKYNYKTDFNDQLNTQRTFTLYDEKGLLLCTWPHGGRPKLPFVYSQEVWTGIEYQIAAHLIYEGFVEEGLTLVKSVRDRHDGYRRNPWDEVECGHHYARATASWAVLLALTGFKLDMAAGTMGFDPVLQQDNFSTFWSNGRAWGIYKQKINPETGCIEGAVEVLYGSLDGVQIQVGNGYER